MSVIWHLQVLRHHSQHLNSEDDGATFLHNVIMSSKACTTTPECLRARERFIESLGQDIVVGQPLQKDGSEGKIGGMNSEVADGFPEWVYTLRGQAFVQA